MLLTGVGLQKKVTQEVNNTIKKTEEHIPDHFLFLILNLFSPVCLNEGSKPQPVPTYCKSLVSVRWMVNRDVVKRTTDIPKLWHKTVCSVGLWTSLININESWSVTDNRRVQEFEVMELNRFIEQLFYVPLSEGSSNVGLMCPMLRVMYGLKTRQTVSTLIDWSATEKRGGGDKFLPAHLTKGTCQYFRMNWHLSYHTIKLWY